MTDHQKIHPVFEPDQQGSPKPTAPMMPHGASDQSQQTHPMQQKEHEAPPRPTAPLVPRGASRSENGDPERLQPRKSPPRKRKSCCRKCLCWACWLIFLLVLLLGIAAAIIYFVFQPKVPKYSVDSMRITQFNVSNDNDNMISLLAGLNVNLIARNPNKKIGIHYESGSHLSVSYVGVKLCEGTLPKFFQGRRNTTVLSLNLTGRTENAGNLLQSLAADQQTGIIPLDLRVKLPIRLKLGKLKLMKWKFLVKCRLNVDTLSQGNVRIRDNKCKVRFRGFD